MEEPVPSNLAYHFKQKVERLERDQEGAAGKSEAYERQGLLLLISKRSVLDWTRFACEYESSEKFLAEARQKSSFSRAKLLAEHRRSRQVRQLEFGFDSEVAIGSDPANQDPLVQGQPVPFHSIDLPTIVPALFAGVPEEGKQWRGVVRLQYGFGEFKVGYSARLGAITVDGPRQDIELDGKEPWAAGANVLLIMKPAGSWKVFVNPLDHCPVRSEGKFQLAIRTEWQESGKKRSFEVGRCGCEFAFERVPVSFDDDNLYPTAWKK